jgi:hypothetical protein
MGPIESAWYFSTTDRLDPVFVPLGSCVYKLESSALCFPSSVMVVVWVCWSYGALLRQLSDCLLQQGFCNSIEGGPRTKVCLWLAPVLVVTARWSIDLDVIYVISSVLCTALNVDE